MENDDVLYLEAIQIAYNSVHFVGESIEETIIDQINHFYEKYHKTEDIDWLKKAFIHMKAYVALGMDYQKYESLFSGIMQKLELSIKDLFENIPVNHKKKLTKSGVKKILGTWMVSEENPKSVVETVDDIISKVKMHEVGTHIYKYTRGKTGYIFELVITDGYVLLRDARNRKNYVFDV